MSIAPTKLQPADDQHTSVIPSPYACTTCGATGVKLWRETGPSTVDIVDLVCAPCETGPWADVNKLVCATCMCAELKKDFEAMDPRMETIHEGIYVLNGSFSAFLPAVPVKGQRSSFWRHGSIPDAGANWWLALPLTA